MPADSAATVAARSLSTYGQSRSRETCANVAAECFVSLLLDVTQAPATERYQWPRAWAAAVDALPGDRDVRGRSPWCEAIVPYLSPGGVLPEGQLDYPCAAGVEEQRQRISVTVQKLSRGEHVGAP